MKTEENGWLLDVNSGIPLCRSEIGTNLFRTPIGVPLDLYLEVQAKALKRNCPVTPASLSLFYTFQSNICFKNFQYVLSPSGGEISFVSSIHPEEPIDQFDHQMDRTSRNIGFSCVEVSDHLARLMANLNAGNKLNDQEVDFFGRETRRFADDAVGGYPYVDVTSQVFGETFLSQRPDCPICSICRREMVFFAAIRRDSRIGTTFIPEGVHVVAHYCKLCNVVNATHFM